MFYGAVSLRLEVDIHHEVLEAIRIKIYKNEKNYPDSDWYVNDQFCTSPIKRSNRGR